MAISLLSGHKNKCSWKLIANVNVPVVINMGVGIDVGMCVCADGCSW